MTDPAEIAGRLASVRDRIASAATRAGREPGEITLVGISKRQPLARITAAVRAGLERLGENFVQEAVAKQLKVQVALEGWQGPAPRWHFVGGLQRNKARDAIRCFDVVETLDRESLGRELERRAAAADRRLDVLLQVDLSGEAQKGGAPPDQIEALLAASQQWTHLRVTGLMAIPAAESDPERSRPAFAKLRLLAESLRGAPGAQSLRELSMGMSKDFEVAIEEGATIVRVGTAIFGPRNGEPTGEESP